MYIVTWGAMSRRVTTSHAEACATITRLARQGVHATFRTVPVRTVVG